MSVGFRILKRQRKVATEIVERFARLPVANVSDSMSRMTAAGARVRPMHQGGAMAGVALTVKTRPGDNLMIHKALLLAEPGDVIVVDAGGDLTAALVGELMLSHAIAIGIAGVVINGAVRDYGWIKSNNFPVFAAGVTHRGPYKDGPGEINVPISVGGMVVNPGDIIVGDDDGFVAVPQSDAAELIKMAKKKLADETASLKAIAKGTVDRSWVDKTLKAKGCEM